MICEFPAREAFPRLLADHSTRLVPSSRLRRSDAQLDLLFRLRIIEKLQDISQPHINHPSSDDYIIDLLNWIALCCSPNGTGDSVAVAFSAQTGHITLYVANNIDSPDLQTVKDCVQSFLTVLQGVLANEDMSPEVATRIFLRKVIDIAHERIERKIALVAETDAGLGQTAYHFTTMVSNWLVYRPEGEVSRGFVNMASNYGGDGMRANEYLIQSLLTLVSQPPDHSANMTPDERHMYLSSIVTACNLLVNSTFFYDLVNFHSFRLSLRMEDRIFLHKLLRRITRIATYKSGSMQFAYLAVPFIRSVVGDMTSGTIDVQFISEAGDKELSGTYCWPESPAERIPLILMCQENIAHSRRSTRGSNSSSSSEDSSNYGCTTELSHLDNQLREELLHSEVLTEAWKVGAPVATKYHSELQLIHYLIEHDVDVAYQAFGTSKPICWTCGCYIDHLPEMEDGSKWWYSKGSGKVYHEWMIPTEAADETIEAVLRESQEQMEQIVEDVAFDCYY